MRSQGWRVVTKKGKVEDRVWGIGEGGFGISRSKSIQRWQMIMLSHGRDEPNL